MYVCVPVISDRKKQSWTQSGVGPDDIKVSLEFSWLTFIKPGGETEEELERWWWCCLAVLTLSIPQ